MWRQIVESDMKKMRLRMADSQDRLKWSNGIWENRLTQAGLAKWRKTKMLRRKEDKTIH